MKALIDYIPENEIEGNFFGELQFDDVNIDIETITPEAYKKIQYQFHPFILPNGEKIEIKVQNYGETFLIAVRENGNNLAHVTAGSTNGSFSFRTLSGATVGMSIYLD